MSRTPQEISAAVARKVDELCDLMNEAKDAGVRVEFAINDDGPAGRFAVQRLDVWQRLAKQ